jgi:hypothetical protein
MKNLIRFLLPLFLASATHAIPGVYVGDNVTGLTATQIAFGANSVDSLILQNTTDSTSSVQQWSPAEHWRASAWSSSAVVTLDWFCEIQSAGFDGPLVISQSYNGGARVIAGTFDTISGLGVVKTGTGGLVLSPYAGDPAGLVNGRVWYNSSTNQMNAYINGAIVHMGGGGGGGSPGGSAYSFQYYATSTSFGGLATNVAGVPYQDGLGDAPSILGSSGAPISSLYVQNLYANAGVQPVVVGSFGSPDTPSSSEAISFNSATGTIIYTSSSMAARTYVLPNATVAAYKGTVVYLYVVAGTNHVNLQPNSVQTTASVGLVLNGVALTAGYYVQAASPAAGNYIALSCDGTTWVSGGDSGTWAGAASP